MRRLLALTVGLMLAVAAPASAAYLHVDRAKSAVINEQQEAISGGYQTGFAITHVRRDSPHAVFVYLALTGSQVTDAPIDSELLVVERVVLRSRILTLRTLGFAGVYRERL